MTLRKRTLLIIGGTMVFLLVVLYLVASNILLAGFEDVEEVDTERNIMRVLGAVEDDISTLDNVTRDWAFWDDTYRFMEDRNPEYVDSNLELDTSWINNRLNLMMYIDENGDVVYEDAFDLIGEEWAEVPESIREQVVPGSLLLRHPDLESGRSGIIMLPEGPMLIASEPILTSEQKGPPRGTLIWGRYLDAAQIERLSQVTRLTILTARLDKPLPEDFQEAQTLITGDDQTAIQKLSDDMISGYAVVNDIYNQPAFIARVDAPRDAFNQGQKTTNYMIVSILAVGLIFGVATIFFLEKWVLSPTADLSRDVSEIGEKGDLSARVKASSRSDELARLSNVINRTMAALEQSESEVHRARDELEIRVRERTAELSEKVAALQTLAEIDKEVIAMSDPQSILDLVCRRAAGLMKTTRASISLSNGDGQESLAASHGFREGESVCSGGQQAGIKQGLCMSAPLVAEGEKLGTLAVCDDKLHDWTTDDEQILYLLAGQVALAIDEARLFKEEKTRREELSTLYGLSRSLADADPDVDTILELVTVDAVEKVHVTFARVALIEKDELVWRAAHPIRVLDRDLGIGQRRPVDEPFCRQLANDSAPMVIRESDASLSEAERDCLFMGIAHTVCMVPIRAGEGMFGLLALGEARSETREPFSEEKLRLALSIADQTASALRRAELFEQLEHSYLETVLALAKAVEAKDTYTSDHAERMAAMALTVGKSMGMSGGELDDLHFGAILHDVGKIGIRDQVLKKPGRLTDEEWLEMKRHPSIGAEILAPVPRLARASKIVRHHHERFEGGGYPDGLAGEDIPLGARILTVVDSFSAMIDQRVYKAALSNDEAVAELKRCAGSQFDPRVVEIFLELFGL